MKVLFAVSNDAISESIIKKYQQMYKEIIVGKNVYYFNAIYKELQKDKTYDRVVISEDLEPFTNNNYDMVDNFIFERLDNISDEATTTTGEDIPIILIATDRRTKSDSLLIKLFGIGVYSALLGQDRSIDEVCKLINKPRTKKEAKVYYKIDSNEVEYKPENEDSVSEQEIQNILTHYKKLGKNEDRYIESFDNIASQYTDEQLKVIIKFLPLNVKAVLEENSPKYQQLTSFRGAKGKKVTSPMGKRNNTDKTINDSGIKIESIGSSDSKITKPVIIPSANVVRKVKVEKPVEMNDIDEDEVLEKIQKIDERLQPEEVIEQPKRGRGRPKKVQIEEEIVEQEVKPEPKRRGRPRKNPVPEVVEQEEILDEEDEDDTILPGFEQIDTLDDIDDDDENFMPGFDDEEEQEDENDSILPGFEDLDSENEEEYEEDNDEDDSDLVLPGFDDLDSENEEEYEEDNDDAFEFDDSYLNEDDSTTNDDVSYNSYNYEENEEEKNIQSYDYNSTQLESLLTGDKKIVAFVGTSKNGTSFLVNNMADMLSKQGIKTAILDLTKNRNAYYIYTKNEEELRKIAYSSIDNLVQGTASGIKVNSYLDVYTSLPGESNDINQYGEILETLAKNYSLIILDCDFKTEYGYIKEAQEIYLVQSMDVLTIQPLTAYLRELKAKQILNPNKLRIVINKATRVRGVTEKVIVGGMAFYNDPAMSFMTELFNRETIKYCSVPFDGQVYSRYLEGLINCNISVNGYPKEFLGALKRLGEMMYPLIGNGRVNNRERYSNPKRNVYASKEPFSNQMNSTLDKMKRNY